MEKILAELAAQIDKLGTAAWDQAPLVYRDIIVAGLVRNGLGVALGVMLFLAAGWATTRAIHGWRLPQGRCKTCGQWNDGGEAAVYALFAAGVTVLGLVIVSTTLPSLLAAWLAPRAYLIDYLR